MSGNSEGEKARFVAADTDCQLIILVDRRTMTAQITGPLPNKAWCLAMLEMAKFAVINFQVHGEGVDEKKIVPANLLPHGFRG